uniref:uncharacterized protein LOC100185757 n=1 Tax=Ciona intestinalis TaxID=7719 RepID=UPI000180C617|nr:uncharacterized protein LOC100185757 [Ciona intestinalis]|eukprot:XP_002130003.1 uncharacterized protein LOC100185757 [Ciona intestinalis]
MKLQCRLLLLCLLYVTSQIKVTSSIGTDLGECACMCSDDVMGNRPTLFSTPEHGRFYESIRGVKGDLGPYGSFGPPGPPGPPGVAGTRGRTADDPFKEQSDKPHVSCLATRESGVTQSGVYELLLTGEHAPFQVYCDMNTAGGGWTLVGSVHENNINGKCTVGDNWSGIEGPLEPQTSSAWVNVQTFGHPEGATSADYKSPAYFKTLATDIMVMQVPNDTPMSSWDSEKLLQFYSNNHFLRNYGGTLQALFGKHYPLKQQPRTNLDEGNLTPMQTAVRNISAAARAAVTNFHMYTYDASTYDQITDGGSDMYDDGNHVYYKIGEQPYKKIVYGRNYRDLASGVQITSYMDHPFMMLMWGANPGGTVPSFSIKVVSGTGADGAGNARSFSGSLTSSNLTCSYQAYVVSGLSDPSIGEVYFLCSNPVTWRSVVTSQLRRSAWSSTTDNLNNAVSVEGNPQNFLMGYTLLSRNNLQHNSIDSIKIEAVLGLIMQALLPLPPVADINCARFNESVIVPVEYIKGSNDVIMSKIPVSSRNQVEPGYIHLRAVDVSGDTYAMCPGVRTSACDSQSVCLVGIPHGHNSTRKQMENCGDFAGWAGILSEHPTATLPSKTARSLNDQKSSFLIFTR